jgi:sulfopyruvate decarboxylase TPP-binding subunit
MIAAARCPGTRTGRRRPPNEEDAVSTVAERNAALIAGIEALRPEFIIHIPSSTLKTILAHCEGMAGVRIFPATREEEAVGIASGLALAGRRCLLIIQDNGIGNSLTALTTFPEPYHLPLLAIVSRRGGLGEYNSMIHRFCEHVEPILQAAQLRYFTLDERVPAGRWADWLVKADEYARITRRPVFLLVNLMAE